MTTEDDRRIGYRAPIELKVEYKRLNTFFADYTRNISRGGTFIGTDKPLKVGTEFVFALGSGWFCFAQTRIRPTFAFSATGLTRL